MGSWWRRVRGTRPGGDAGPGWPALPGTAGRPGVPSASRGAADPHTAAEGGGVAGERLAPGADSPERAAADPPAGTGAPGAPAAPEPAGQEDAAPLPPARDDLPRLGFVGAGRVGTALAVAFRRAGWPVTAVSSRAAANRERFVALVPGARAFAEPPAILDDADLVLLTVPDDAIAAVASSLRLYSGQAIVHTSGVLGSDVLAPALAAGTERGSFHPLVAFADHDAALAALPGASVAIEGDEPLLPLLEDLAVSIGARPVRIASDAKAAHHAAAVLAAGGLVALLDAVAELGRAAGLDEHAALEAYGPLARGGLGNVERLGIAASLTGPVVRGDAGTIEAHLAAIRRLAPGVEPAYAALLRRQVALASGRGDLPAEAAARILAALDAP